MFGEVRNAQGERLDYSFHEGSRNDGDLVVVIAHGVTGNKDRPFVVALAKGLSAAGVVTVRMSFSGNGDSEGRFEDSTISKEVEDLGAMFEAVGDRPICLIGHSMGAAVGVTRAGHDDRVRWLGSLAGMVHTRKFVEREFADVTPDQGCMWDDVACPLSSTYLDDMNAIDSVVELGSQIAVPWLLVHGSEDDVVPLSDSRDILARAGSNAHLEVLESIDHVFSDDGIAPMVNLVTAWVREQVK